MSSESCAERYDVNPARPPVEQATLPMRYYTSEPGVCDEIRATFGDRMECVTVRTDHIPFITSLADYIESKRDLLTSDMYAFYSNLYTPQTDFFEGLDQSHFDGMVEWAKSLPTNPTGYGGLRGKIIIPWSLLARAYLPVPGTTERIEAYVSDDSGKKFRKDIKLECPATGGTFFSGESCRMFYDFRGYSEFQKQQLRTNPVYAKAHTIVRDGWYWDINSYLNTCFGSVERRNAFAKTVETLHKMMIEVFIERVVPAEGPSRFETYTTADGGKQRHYYIDMEGALRRRSSDTTDNPDSSLFRFYVYNGISSVLVHPVKYNQLRTHAVVSDVPIVTIFRMTSSMPGGMTCKDEGISLYNWGVHRPYAVYYELDHTEGSMDYWAVHGTKLVRHVLPADIEAAYSEYKRTSSAFGRRHRLRRDAHGRFV